ncbi:MAG: potassium transporter TrkH [Firmicutes bacterium]|nr:potassium transporter TrkH [Bacillota bacterium]
MLYARTRTDKIIYSFLAHPGRLIVLSFLFVILLGSFLLNLPWATKDGIEFTYFDALFTATSATCVTGLIVADTQTTFTVFGKIVLICLIQIGGLGVITVVATLMMLARKRFSLSSRLALRDALNLDSISGLLGFLSRIVRGTLIVEIIGALLYMIAFVPAFGARHGIWVSVFNSVSAFCNAGLDILGPDSLAPFRTQPLVLIVTMLLIITGGIGYVVWMDLSKKTVFGIKRSFSLKQIIKRLSEHTKLVLSITLTLIIAGALLVFLAERNNPDTIGRMSLPMKILNSLFESVTFRTAGFATFAQKGITDITCVAAYLLMFIGGSPIGTAGGVKTTTFYLYLLNISSYIRGKSKVKVFNRNISGAQMKKASVIVEVSAITVIVLTLLLIATNPVDIKDGLFEIMSACATVGLTRGVTTTLNVAGKLIVTLAMYLGRIGPISMAMFLARGKSAAEPEMQYADGNFYIG